jgi:hypothetical protein
MRDEMVPTNIFSVETFFELGIKKQNLVFYVREERPELEVKHYHCWLV